MSRIPGTQREFATGETPVPPSAALEAAMLRVTVIGWQPGLRKISMTKLYRRELKITLGPAKAMTDAVLNGEIVEFEVETEQQAERVAEELRNLGALVEVHD
jgi:ribosomal protein L7/L12